MRRSLSLGAVFAIVGLLLAGALAACGGSTEEPAASGSAAAGGGGGEELNYVMCIKDPTAPFEQAFREGALKEAEKLGVTVDIRNGEADSLKIQDIMDNAITQGADGFIMAGAVDLKAIVPGVERLNEAGIPIIALDTSPEGGKVDYFISFDLKESSKKAAEEFVQGIKDRNGGEVPEGVVIYIQGAPQDMFTQACNEGVEEVFGQYPQLEVAAANGEWNNETSNQRTSDLLTRYGDAVLGVYVMTPDIMGPGAVEAIRSAGKNPADYGMCGICIGPEGLALINAGEVLAIVEQPALASAELAVRYLTDINKGNPTPQIGDTVTEEGQIWSPAQVVENPWADGAYMILAAPLVPTEVPADDPQLWENQLSHLWQ
jgi:ribose transport system substrate-binding protein